MCIYFLCELFCAKLPQATNLTEFFFLIKLIFVENNNNNKLNEIKKHLTSNIQISIFFRLKNCFSSLFLSSVNGKLCDFMHSVELNLVEWMWALAICFYFILFYFYFSNKVNFRLLCDLMLTETAPWHSWIASILINWSVPSRHVAHNIKKQTQQKHTKKIKTHFSLIICT